MSNYEYLGKKEIYKRVIIRDILYLFLSCLKSSVQPLKLSQVIRL